jgi:hypothetical protein
LIHPAGLYAAGNYNIWDEFPSPGTTGEISPVEMPTIGNYAPYRIETTANLRNNASSVDLYPCGWNPYVAAAGVSYTSGHYRDSGSSQQRVLGANTGGLWYRDEEGASGHDPFHKPLGLTGNTGGLDASQYGVSFWRIFHHPNSWTNEISSGVSFGDISLGQFAVLTAINSVVGSPNNPTESSSSCGH